MLGQVSKSHLMGYRFLRPIISYAVRAYHHFALSLREDIVTLLGFAEKEPITPGQAAFNSYAMPSQMRWASDRCNKVSQM